MKELYLIIDCRGKEHYYRSQKSFDKGWKYHKSFYDQMKHFNFYVPPQGHKLDISNITQIY